MIRIVIADDEQFIVQLICSLIDREALGVEVVGTASDGRGALEMTLEKKPDILITDIRMPCMDGIELIEHLRREGASTSVIAISGYKCFDYAYNAIKYGVEDFIVKPINKKELNASIPKNHRASAREKRTLFQNPGSGKTGEQKRRAAARKTHRGQPERGFLGKNAGRDQPRLYDKVCLWAVRGPFCQAGHRPGRGCGRVDPSKMQKHTGAEL